MFQEQNGQVSWFDKCHRLLNVAYCVTNYPLFIVALKELKLIIDVCLLCHFNWLRELKASKEKRLLYMK